MQARYNAGVIERKPFPALRTDALPALWLLSDARNDDGLEEALIQMPPRSAFIYRHYHLAPGERWERFRQLRERCRARGHLLILADSAQTALEWGADGIYGAPLTLVPRRGQIVTIATAHDMREIGQANRMGADAVMLSPVFATRSHPGGHTLGARRFRTLARHARVPVIALGGMDQDNARALGWHRWAAIDGLLQKTRLPPA